MEQAHDGFDELEARLSQELDTTASYASTRGDVMLELTLERPDPEFVTMVLKVRKKPIYTHSDGTDVDVAAYSGLDVPEMEIIADIPVTKEKTGFNFSESIPFEDGLVASRDHLAEAVQQLFTIIRDYECHQIRYEKAFDGHGIDRKAHVSVTGLDQLRRFKTPETDLTPGTYHTVDACNKPLITPAFSNGCTVHLLPTTQWANWKKADDAAEPDPDVSGPTLVYDSSTQ